MNPRFEGEVGKGSGKHCVCAREKRWFLFKTFSCRCQRPLAIVRGSSPAIEKRALKTLTAGMGKDWKQSHLRVTKQTLPYLGKKEMARSAWLFSAANTDGFALAFKGDG